MDDTTLDWKQKQKLMKQVFPTIEGVWEGTYRTRVWQWIKDDGGIFRRTIIDERRVSENWRDYADDLEGL